MSTLKIIGFPASRTVRTIWMAEELGLKYECDPIHYTDSKLKASPYTDWNPNGAIPIILTDGKPLFESLAINLFLADKHGGPLAGTNAEERGEITQWTLWAATSVEPDLGQWSYHTVFLPEAERKPEMAAAAIEKLKKPLNILESVMSARAYLVGNRFTVADLNLAAVSWRLLSLPTIGQYPNVKAYIEKCWARPAALVARRARGEKV